MIETINKLRPIERLYLISLENKEVYNKKNALKCLIYALINNNNIKYKKSYISISLNGKENNKEYEEIFLSLLKEKDYIKLNELIDDLKIFNQSLINQNIMKLNLRVKKFLFLKLAKEELLKTPMYYEIQAYYSKLLDSNNILDIVCDNKDYKYKVDRFYNIIKKKVKKAYEKEKLKKNNKDE